MVSFSFVSFLLDVRHWGQMDELNLEDTPFLIFPLYHVTTFNVPFILLYMIKFSSTILIFGSFIFIPPSSSTVFSHLLET